MLHRGSLKQCVLAMAASFKTRQYQLLSIVHNAQGKYYTLMDESDLLKYQERYMVDRVRLVCTLSAKELRAFADNDQLTLSLGGLDAQDKKNQQEREQRRNHSELG